MTKQTKESLYRQYVLARKYVWQRNDQLVSQGKTTQEVLDDKKYRRLCEKEHTLFNQWQG